MAKRLKAECRGMSKVSAKNPRSRIERDARSNHRVVTRAIGEEIRKARLDVGISLSRCATGANVAKGYLYRIEAGDAHPTIDVLARIAAALGGRISLHYQPGSGPALRDHLQAGMLEALLRLLHPRWRRFAEVGVYRPVRGVIDLVLDEPEEGVLIASEAQSQLRRLEQQFRWARAKADALAAGGASELSLAALKRNVSRLLLLRNTGANRELVRAHHELIAAAYPASHAAALAALTGKSPWPGPALIWAEATRAAARVLDRPPRGIYGGRA